MLVSQLRTRRYIFLTLRRDTKSGDAPGGAPPKILNLCVFDCDKGPHSVCIINDEGALKGLIACTLASSRFRFRRIAFVSLLRSRV